MTGQDGRESELVACAQARAAAAEDRLRSQSMLIAEAEHRLKTTLAVITGWAGTLDDRWEQLDEGRKREAIGIIRRASEGMASEARQLLDEARAEMALLDSAPLRLDLREVLEVNAAAFGGLSHGHAIVHATDPSVDVVVEVDPGALQQVLGHLLENAVKYSPAGTTVTVAARREATEVVIDVRDEGRGLPPEIDVFAPFQRGATDAEGAGLGLYIVRNLVRTMGGAVEATTNPGAGSTFSVRLPA